MSTFKIILKVALGTIVAIIVCALCFAGGTFVHLLNNMTISDTAQSLNQGDPSANHLDVPNDLPNDFYMLLLGVDSSTQRESGDEAKFFNGAFRSDSIIVAHVDLSREKIALCSLERDIQTEINGYEENGYDKLNAAYALGGVELMREEAQELVGVPIPYYAIVDMTGMTELIDAFGGVEVDVERAFWDTMLKDGIEKGGKQTLNGQQAVLYARSRYAWEEGDFARARHQREVLRALAKKIMSMDTDLMSLYSAAETVSTKISTNFTFPQMYKIATKLQGIDVSRDIYSMMTPTEGSYLNGVSYQVLIEDEWEEVLDDLRSLTDPEARKKAEEARKIDEDGDGWMDADANLDGEVSDKEWAAYKKEHRVMSRKTVGRLLANHLSHRKNIIWID